MIAHQILNAHKGNVYQPISNAIKMKLATASRRYVCGDTVPTFVQFIVFADVPKMYNVRMESIVNLETAKQNFYARITTSARKELSVGMDTVRLRRAIARMTVTVHYQMKYARTIRVSSNKKDARMI